MIISNLFIHMGLKPEIWAVLLYPSQLTSGGIFHSLVQFPVHKVFIPSSLSQRERWCLSGGELNICPKAYRESCTFLTFGWEKGAPQSPLPWISDDTLGVHSEIQPMARAETVLVCLSQAFPASWHMPSPGFPLFCLQILSPLLIVLTPWQYCLRNNSSSSCFFRKSDLATAWPEAFPTRKHWESHPDFLDGSRWGMNHASHRPPIKRRILFCSFTRKTREKAVKTSLTLTTNSGLETTSIGLGCPWAYPFWQSTEWTDSAEEKDLRRNGRRHALKDQPFCMTPGLPPVLKPLQRLNGFPS